VVPAQEGTWSSSSVMPRKPAAASGGEGGAAAPRWCAKLGPHNFSSRGIGSTIWAACLRGGAHSPWRSCYPRGDAFGERVHKRRGFLARTPRPGLCAKSPDLAGFELSQVGTQGLSSAGRRVVKHRESRKIMAAKSSVQARERAAHQPVSWAPCNTRGKVNNFERSNLDVHGSLLVPQTFHAWVPHARDQYTPGGIFYLRVGRQVSRQQGPKPQLPRNEESLTMCRLLMISTHYERVKGRNLKEFTTSKNPVWGTGARRGAGPRAALALGAVIGG